MGALALTFAAAPSSAAQDTVPTGIVPPAAFPPEVAARDAAGQEARPAIEAELHGLMLLNAFSNGGRVNNSDVPQFVLPPDPAAGAREGALGATIRQSRVIATARVPGFVGGGLSGELDVDFFGGQQPSTGGRTFPLVRLRRVFAELTWDRYTLLVGQESPPIAAVSPVSLASIGFPDFAGAGNLWLWIPQVRFSGDVTERAGITFAGEVALLAPTSGDAQAAFFTQPDVAERSRRPYIQGRVRARWGEGDSRSEASLGGHFGWLTVGTDESAHSRAIVASVWTFLPRRIELRAELFRGQAIAGLGGGGIGQNFGPDSFAVATKGGWIQLNGRPAPEWEAGAGIGIDDPDDGDLDPRTQRLRNLAYAAHGAWRRAPIVVGLELRRLETQYGGAVGERGTTHANLAVGFEF